MSSSKEHDTPIDVRALERDLKRGKMTRKEHEKALKGLPDVKAKAMSMADASPAPGGAVEALGDDDIDDEDDLDDEADGDAADEPGPA
jgi:hypothetical protein